MFMALLARATQMIVGRVRSLSGTEGGHHRVLCAPCRARRCLRLAGEPVVGRGGLATRGSTPVGDGVCAAAWTTRLLITGISGSRPNNTG